MVTDAPGSTGQCRLERSEGGDEFNNLLQVNSIEAVEKV